MEYKNTNDIKTLGVVTIYNPEIELAINNVSAYLPYIDKLIVWNNTISENDFEYSFSKVFKDTMGKIIWKENHENLGIAKALNFAFNYGKENKYRLLLIMDQDSHWVNFDGYLKTIKKQYLAGNIHAYTPNVGGYENAETEIIDKDSFINSGTVLPFEIIDKVGSADETFAIDSIDEDYSLRIRQAGFKIKCYTNYFLEHILGDPIRSKIFLISTPNHNAYRTFTIAFSHIVLVRKHHRFLKNSEKWFYIKEHIIYKFIRIVLIEKDKMKKLRMLALGIYKGVTYKI